MSDTKEQETKDDVVQVVEIKPDSSKLGVKDNG